MAVKRTKRKNTPVTASGAGRQQPVIPTITSAAAAAAAADPLSLLKSLTRPDTLTTSATSSLLAVTSSKAVARKKSSLATAQLIRRYHTLNKELSKCLARIDAKKKQSDSGLDTQKSVTSEQTAADLARIVEIRQEMDDLGGLDMYQKASTLGQSKQRGGDSSKWLIPILEDYHRQLGKKAGTPLRLLDIGALSPHNYQKQSSWIHTTPIDLNPQDPLITKMDFLEMPVPKDQEHLFNVVCLSLVVNFVGDPTQRGEILRYSARFLVPGTGILYLVLPLPCIQNSRYFDHELLLEMMTSLGYTTLVNHHFAKKLAYYAFRLDAAAPKEQKRHSSMARTNIAAPMFPKKLRHDKPNRNK
ncbi:hypothetical protein BGZ99_008721 [Dissophora globulifera]|uniref:25S rRNA adenine-N(1) methyltransferase n=1 Tax=Dissophora globulifera TaxID=979702 RepID=A0A9P6R7K0_9FUNG|nr:hypothetical protein BGZ99_008721 [Dissophora globulifera]